MANGIGTVEVKRQRKALTIMGMGQTPRGQKFIKKSIPITAPRMNDKKFKAELAAAVEELLG